MPDHLLGSQLASGQSLASSFTTPPVRIIGAYNVGVIIETFNVSANTGTFQPQVRIKKDANTYSGWVNITSPSGIVVTLANGNIATFLDFSFLPPCELQFVFTPGGGSPNGTSNIWIAATRV